MTNKQVRKEMSRRTYQVEHSPNCPSKFLVRLVCPGMPRIDKKYYDETKDILGFGTTFESAARAALREQRKVRETRRRERPARQSSKGGKS